MSVVMYSLRRKRDERRQRIPYQLKRGLPDGAAPDRFVQPTIDILEGATVHYRVAEREFSYPRRGMWHDRAIKDYTHEIQLWEDLTIYKKTRSRMLSAKWCYPGLGTGSIDYSRDAYQQGADALNGIDTSHAVGGMFVSYTEAADDAVMTLQSVHITSSFWAHVSVHNHRSITIPNIKSDEALVAVAHAKAELHMLRDELHAENMMKQRAREIEAKSCDEAHDEDQRRSALLKAIATGL